MLTDLFLGNFFILFLLFVISVIAVEQLNEKQKISIIYICSYGITFDGNVSKKILCPLIVFMIFLVMEYFTVDKKKMVILKKFHYKLCDFIYMSIFQYKIWAILGAIALRSGLVKNILKNASMYVDFFSVAFLVVSIHWMFNLTEEFYSFTYIYEKIRNYPYHKVNFDEDLRERLNIIVEFEDRLYWQRKKTYSIASFEFFKVWYQDKHKKNKINKKIKLPLKDKIIKILKFPITSFITIRKICKNIVKFLNYFFGFFLRGHSTIPMQLIRILSYKHGLVFGNSKIPFKKYKIFKRKIYEILYSRMFFKGLKNYLSVELCNEMKFYDEYLVYLYPQIVQTTLDGKTYAPASVAFTKFQNNKGSIPPLNEWDLKKVIKMAFGFNGLKLTEERKKEREDIIEKYGFSIDEI